MTPRLNPMVVLLVLAAGSVQAQSGGRGPTGQLLYPAKGQTAQQAERDRFECHAWARDQTGFDPTQMAAMPAAAPPAGQPAATRGHNAAVAGAAGGAAIAELADKDAGKGAAIGLLGGGLLQQMQQRQGAAQQQQVQQQQLALQQHAATSQRRDAYERGFAACMEARGYIVK